MSEEKKHYLTNRVLLEEFLLSKEQDQPTDNLARAFILLVERYARRPNFIGYSWIEEMKGEAILTLCMNWHKFNPEKSSNVFSYLTQITHNAFLHYLNKEKRQTDTKNAIRTDAGYEEMGHGPISWDEDADVSEVYDLSHEYETTEQVEHNPEEDMV